MVTQLSALPDETVSPLHAGPSRSKTSPRQIPWGYGRDRVTAVAVDPLQLFVYWEVRDETIEKARSQLGPAGARAALTLRIYDTSGRIFDGTNAHSYFDQDFQRNDRQWFCSVGKPNSAAHIEMGLRTPDGRFGRIARSGRVDFPRAEPAVSRTPEWMRVVADTGAIASREPGAAEVVGAAGAHTPITGGEVLGEPKAPTLGGVEQILDSKVSELTGSFESYTREGYDWKQVDYERSETDTGWQTDSVDPALMHRVITTSWQEFGFGVMSWESGPSESSWEAGPFHFPTEVIVPAAERFEAPTQVYRVGEQVRVLHGPWQVVIRGIQAHASRRILARWEVHRSWVSAPGRSPETLAGAVRHSLPLGSSGHTLSASELRLRGASEVFFLGASERRLGGASELRFLAASQWIAKGASERRFMGASEWRMSGASERRLMGASERRLMGASERHSGGASERRLGASEPRLTYPTNSKG